MDIELFKGAHSFVAELLVDEDTGEIGGEFPLDVLVHRNPVGTAAYVLNTLANADMIASHIASMKRKMDALKNNAERAKTALREVMAATGVTSIKSDDGLFKVTLQHERDVSVDVFDEAQLPDEFIVEKTTTAPDKKKIKSHLDEGLDVPGARLQYKDRLTIG